MAESEKENPVGLLTGLVGRIDDGLYLLLNTRVAVTLLALAGIEALVAVAFGQTKWAIFSLATAVVAIGLILAAGGLWIQCLGDSARKISQFYGREVLGAATQSKAAGPLPSWRN